MDNVVDVAVSLLDELDCSCVIITREGEKIVCNRRGIADLYDILKVHPEQLHGATVADKVVGKGAAALMAAGGVLRVHTHMISRDALMLFKTEGVEVTYDAEVDYIINRAGTGRCPVESMCDGFKTASECLPAIDAFIEGLRNRVSE